METKHTKKDWEYCGGGNAFVEVNIGDVTIDIGRTSKFSEKYIIERDEMEANGKLIAAAPDLLETLVRLIDRIDENGLQDRFPSAYVRAREAIKKATT